MDLPDFAEGVECERCYGPLRAIPFTITEFIEKTGDYINQTYRGCFMCGHEQILEGSEPYYAI